MDSTATRRLAAILAADVAGYSRLMGADEQRTVAGLRAHRSGLTDPKIAKHHGRIVNTAGDSVLAEFASVLDAVRCAAEIQQGVAGLNADVPEQQRIVFRIGINVGDVIFEGAEVYGDGVNIAARLEGICDPGGICIAANVYDQVHDKLPYTWEDRGQQHLKNIADPVRAYRWKPGAAVPIRKAVRRRPWWLGAAALAALLVAAGWAGYRTLPLSRSVKPAALSIVVLPFDNLSQDPAQDYFVSGLTDNLTTDLSRIAGSFVIARNTAFTYKGKAVDVKQVARELNVRYVLEGSVQRQDRAVRVNVQLIDGATGAHVWSERFDRTLEGVFALQNEVTAHLANALRLQLLEAESLRVQRAQPASLAAEDYVLRGRYELSKAATLDNTRAALPWFQKALELDPQNAQAWTGFAQVHGRAGMNVAYALTGSRGKSLQLALDAAKRGVAINPGDAAGHQVLAGVLLNLGKWEQAFAESEQSLQLDPNLFAAHILMAAALITRGRAEEVFTWTAKARALSPRDPQGYLVDWQDARAHLFLGQDREAVESARKGLAQNDKFPPLWQTLAGAHAKLGEIAKAKVAVARFVELAGPMKLQDIRVLRNASVHPKYHAQVDRFIEGLAKAGVPEN